MSVSVSATKRSDRGVVAMLVALCAGCAHQRAATEPDAPAAVEAAAAPLSAEPAAPSASPSLVSAMETQELTYQTPSTTMKGFIAYPASVSGKRPGVLVVHEWWGQNEYARKRAMQLAELGYVGLAVDMYGEGQQASHPEDAKKFMMEVMGNLEVAVSRFEAARRLLANDPRVDPEKIAAIGYCMGGAVVLHMARLGTDLDAVASFHGNLATQAPMKPDTFHGKLLIAHGGSDPFVPAEQLAAFEKEMQAANASYELSVYPNAKHGFTNPGATANGEKFGLPLAYDAEADAESWRRLERVLAEIWPED